MADRTLTPEQRAAWLAAERIATGDVPEWLREGVREIVAQESTTPRQRRLASLQAEVARRYPDPAARMAALSDPKPGTPEHTLFNAVLGKPAAFVADHPVTLARSTLP